MRWALGEDADLWLPLRGQISRTSSCVWCGNQARNCPAGPAYGALRFTCVGDNPGPPMALSDDAVSFVNRHAPNFSVRPLSLTPITTKFLASHGPLRTSNPVPCVLCQEGANAIDHWLSYCPAVYIAWCVLRKGCPPPINWRQVPMRHTGVALRYLLFHVRRMVAEYGGLRPVIKCVKLRSVSRYAITICTTVALEK